MCCYHSVFWTPDTHVFLAAFGGILRSDLFNGVIICLVRSIQQSNWVSYYRPLPRHRWQLFSRGMGMGVGGGDKTVL